MADELLEFKQVQINGQTYVVKDEVARQAIAGGLSFDIVWSNTDYASTTAPTAAKLAGIPSGVVVYYNNGSSSATGTKTASATTTGFYLVYRRGGTDASVYDEYVAVKNGTSYFWEKIGSTSLELKGLVTNVSFVVDNTSSADKKVLGAATTFSVDKPTVTVNYDTDEVIVGVDPTIQKLVTTSIKGVAGTDTVVPAVAIATGSRPTRTVLGTTKTVHDHVGDFQLSGTADVGTEVTVGTALSGTKTFTTNGIKSASLDGTQTFNTDAIKSATLEASYTANSETLVLSVGTTAASTGTVSLSTTDADTGTVGLTTTTVTPAVQTSRNMWFLQDGTGTAISVPQIESNAEVEVAKAGTAKTFATASSSSTTVATGSISASGTGGSVVVSVDTEGLDVVTGITDTTVSAQTVTVGNNDKVKLSVTKHS